MADLLISLPESESDATIDETKAKVMISSLGKSAVISDVRFFASVGSELHLRVLTRKNKLKRRITGTRGH